MRRACVGLAAMLLAAAGPGAPQSGGKDVVRMSEAQQKTIGLQTEPVVRQPIIRAVHVPGEIIFDPSRVADLRPLAESRVIRLLVQVGETVRVGQGLASLQSTSIAADQSLLTEAEASERETRTQIAVAREALHRAVILVRDGAMARAQQDQRRLLLAEAEARQSAAGARAANLRDRLQRLGASGKGGLATLTSPIPGQVTQIGVTPGQVAGPGMTQSAIVVADLSSVVVLAQVPEAQAAVVKVGDKAAVQFASGQAGGAASSWTGSVASVGAALDSTARTLPVRINLANPDGVLHSGMFVDVTLFDRAGHQGLVVPPDAIQTIADKPTAFTPEGKDGFRSHTLELGVSRQDWVEVRHGLSVGDKVVTQGSFALKAVMQKTLLEGGG
ncbi:efflux RND transporter periplasmic adaptor subunit [Lichenicoccus sp.]|uniref:efflux RND transporter periplasmic adaptor subunit n=1 Tax=Lichenicoccus sp. TaxID=2781899 RepID=UPI003D09D599